MIVTDTLCVVYLPPMLLLGMKLRGFGEGKWNGPGGKVETDKGETIPDACLRESKEEVGIDIISMEKMGVLHFKFEGKPLERMVHIFWVKEFSGEICQSDEMAPRWFHKDHIPYGDMWLDDEKWLPLLLEGKKFTGWFQFDYDGKVILAYELDIVEELPV